MDTTTQKAISPLEPSTATMRTLIGVDHDDLYIPALDLIARLRFDGNHVTLGHVEPSVGPQLGPAPIVYDFRDAAELEEAQKKGGQAILRTASDLARNAGLSDGLMTAYAVGSTSTTLMHLAEEHRSDLLAIGSAKRGPLGSFFLGSVGRALAIGANFSFLVGRGEPRSGPVRAVFATDHSEYAARCFRRLLDMKPQGIRRLTIVTATDPASEAHAVKALGDVGGEPYALSMVESRYRETGTEMMRLCQERGCEAEYRLVEGHPVDVIRDAMEQTDSDLLILGARGHGLMKRVLIGSLALHMVVAEPFSVMVLRIPEQE